MVEGRKVFLFNNGGNGWSPSQQLSTLSPSIPTILSL